MRVMKPEEVVAEFGAYVPLVFESNLRSTLNVHLESLEVGGGVFISRDEWAYKSKPGVYVGSAFRSQRSPKYFRTVALQDGSGWLVLRLK